MIKWQRASRNYPVGVFVLLVDDNAKPKQWHVGRIIETFPGPDGLIWVVSVRTGSDTLRSLLCEDFENIISKLDTASKPFRELSKINLDKASKTGFDIERGKQNIIDWFQATWKTCCALRMMEFLHPHQETFIKLFIICGSYIQQMYLVGTFSSISFRQGCNNFKTGQPELLATSLLSSISNILNLL